MFGAKIWIQKILFCELSIFGVPGDLRFQQVLKISTMLWYSIMVKILNVTLEKV